MNNMDQSEIPLDESTWQNNYDAYTNPNQNQ